MAIGKNKKIIAIIVGTIVLLGLAYAGYCALTQVRPGDGYQAVFLRGGQVYFGKLALGEKWLILTDIYYLQAAQSLQAGVDSSGATPGNFQLIKLGTELHAPEDTMYIRIEDVSFWENLTTGSRIIEAIEKYKSSR